jgi:hypothetical protein
VTARAHLHERLAVGGGYEFLAELESRSSQSRFAVEDILALMNEAGIEDAEGVLSDLLEASVLGRIGEGIGITSFGIRAKLLLDAVNGAELRQVFARLGRYDSNLRMYELVREGMTRRFLENLHARPGFRRLYLCSPWMSFDDRSAALLLDAVNRAGRHGETPEVLVLTRPADGTTDVPPPSIHPLRTIGATVFLNRQLHTKLYIREPDASGGYSMAIVGSQNLTKSRYLELGIRINSDSKIISQLITYFWDVTNASTEPEEEPA